MKKSEKENSPSHPIAAAVWQRTLAFLHWPHTWALFFGAGFLLLLAERLLTLVLLPEELPVWYAFGAWLGDSVWAALLLAMALAFRSRILAWCGALVLMFALLFHAFNLALLHSTISVVSYVMCRTLLENTDATSLGVYLGPFYWFYLLTGLLLLAGLVAAAGESFTVLFNRKKYGLGFLVCAFGFLGLVVGGGFSFLKYYNYAKAEILYKGCFPREWGARPVQQYCWDLIADASKMSRKSESSGHEGFFKSEQPLPKVAARWRKLGLTGDAPAPIKRFEPYRKIMIIAVESLDLDFILSERMPAGLTPFLHRLAAGGVPGASSFMMTNYYTSTQPTSDGLNSLLASRLLYNRDLDLKNESLYSVLERNGYAGYYFNGISGTFHNQREELCGRFGVRNIFFLEDLFAEKNVRGDGYWGVDDVTLFNATYEKLRAAKDEKLFCVVSTIDTHPPYRTATLLERDYANPFLNSIAALDRNLERFLLRVIGDDWFDDGTLIVITADHSATHGENYLKRTELIPDRIPLIFLEKTARLNGRIPVNRMCSAIDFAPTLLHLLGMESPKSFMGRSFLEPLGRAVSICGMETVLLRRDADAVLKVDPAAAATEQEQAVAAWLRLYYGR